MLYAYSVKKPIGELNLKRALDEVCVHYVMSYCQMLLKIVQYEIKVFLLRMAM